MELLKRLSQAALGLVIVTGCNKQADNSSIQSLDGFAGGSAVHQCSGKFQNNEPYLSYFKGGSAAARDAAKTSLSALPPALKDEVFFGGAKVNVVFTDNVTEFCAGSTVAEAYRNQPKKPFLSCHKPLNGEFVIFLSNQPQDIRRGLVRALAYYLSDVGDRLALDDGRTVLNGFADPELILEKDELALAFLDDVAASKQFKVSTFNGMISQSILKANDESSRRQAWYDTRGIDSSARKVFSEFVFAEAIDSFYCSASSRNVLTKSFPRTAEILGLEPSKGEDGLALWGRRARQCSCRKRFYNNAKTTTAVSQYRANPGQPSGRNTVYRAPVNVKTAKTSQVYATKATTSPATTTSTATTTTAKATTTAQATTTAKVTNAAAKSPEGIQFDSVNGIYSNYPNQTTMRPNEYGSYSQYNLNGAETGVHAKYNKEAGKWDYFYEDYGGGESKNAADFGKDSLSSSVQTATVEAKGAELNAATQTAALASSASAFQAAGTTVPNGPYAQYASDRTTLPRSERTFNDQAIEQAALPDLPQQPVGQLLPRTNYVTPSIATSQVAFPDLPYAVQAEPILTAPTIVPERYSVDAQPNMSFSQTMPSDFTQSAAGFSPSVDSTFASNAAGYAAAGASESVSVAGSQEETMESNR